MPLDLSGGSLSGASFGSSPYVVAVGGYNINSQDYPFIVTSSNSGASWETTLDSTLALPTNYSAAGGFVSASFSGTNFVAVGGYYATTGGGTNQPLIATSSSSTGDLWTYTFDGSYMPAGYSGGLSSASCTSSYCIAVGYSNDGNTLISYPLIVSATNTGASWSIILGTSSSTAGLPSDYHSNGVLDACFSGSTAFAVGSYSNSSYDIYPLIMTSTNSGDTWTSTLDSSNISSVLGPYYGQANLYGITCLSDTPTTCIAVGSYMSTSTTRYPFIVISTNSGSTWSNSTLTLPSDYDSTSSGFTNQQALLGITCSGSTCVAMGNYMSTNNSIVYPLIVTSTNSGGSWTSTLDSSTPSLPSGYSGYPNGLYY